MRITRRDLLAAAAIIVLIALVAIGGLQALRGNQPQVSKASASAVALRQLAQMNPAVHGFAVVSASYDPTPDRVYDNRGNLIYSESHSFCPIWIFRGPAWLCHAEGVWIVYLRAPAQGGFVNQNGHVLVNGRNGTVSGASTEATN